MIFFTVKDGIITYIFCRGHYFSGIWSFPSGADREAESDMAVNGNGTIFTDGKWSRSGLLRNCRSSDKKCIVSIPSQLLLHAHGVIQLPESACTYLE